MYLFHCFLLSAYLDVEASDLPTNSQQGQLPGCVCHTGPACRRASHFISALGGCPEILNTLETKSVQNVHFVPSFANCVSSPDGQI